MTTTLPPAVGDPIVIDGGKYRIKSIDPTPLVAGGSADIAMCQQSFAPRDTRWERVDQMVWDRVVGVWRVQS